MTEGVDTGARLDSDVTQNAIRPDLHPFFKRDLPFEHATDIDTDITPTGQRATNVDARRIRQTHPFDHELLGLMPLPDALERGQLHFRINASDFPIMYRETVCTGTPACTAMPSRSVR